ncbi:unnamed protein product [Notodromas monacha]|uniref:Uncharacterized protein n=1 Tax=Notodromas monacha TaxID=399045 RepID=A0A7R9BUJ9_9CRUS|nr:unnamed protein product [Notodromas monacha]CAG0921019.1 unnamed protein product [Notodromas monacha]
MASSSVSQDDIDNDFEKCSRRSKIRTARAHKITPPSKIVVLYRKFSSWPVEFIEILPCSSDERCNSVSISPEARSPYLSPVEIFIASGDFCQDLISGSRNKEEASDSWALFDGFISHCLTRTCHSRMRLDSGMIGDDEGGDTSHGGDVGCAETKDSGEIGVETILHFCVLPRVCSFN